MLRALGLHAALSLLDAAVLAAPLLPEPSHRRAFVTLLHVAVCFWVPLAVARAGFRKMGGLAFFC